LAQPTTLALVPARGGSKSIPLKNIKLLAGRPLLEYGLHAITDSGVVDRTVVTTDHEQIAEVARMAGADVPFMRPGDLAGDDTPTIPVIAHALSWLDEHEGYRPECVLLVQPTEPFVRPEQIRDALTLMLARDAESAITVVEVPRNAHPYHVRTMDDAGWLEFADPDAHYAHPTRQGDPPRWAFGNLYWFRRESFLRTGRIETGRRVGLPIDALSAIDVNGEADWTLAEALAIAAIEL
jgi:CMP-N,N'-diacetyllegionaminic acid synthase